jgi:hypothetical protein
MAVTGIEHGGAAGFDHRCCDSRRDDAERAEQWSTVVCWFIRKLGFAV